MNDKLRYEQQLTDGWNDLPLPDENAAWADMKRRLEEDDDKPIVPFWLRGCALWGILGVLLLGGGWWWYTNRHQQANKKSTADIVIKKAEQIRENKEKNEGDALQKESASVSDTSVAATLPVKNTAGADNAIKNNESFTTQLKNTSGNKLNGTKKTTAAQGSNASSETTGVRIPKTKNAFKKNNAAMLKYKNTTTAKRRSGTSLTIQPNKATKKDSAGQQTLTQGNSNVKIDPPIADKKKKEDVIAAVSVAGKSQDTVVVKKDTAATHSPLVADIKQPAAGKKDSTKKKYWYFSTGIALQQQLPLGGQNFVPFSASGRKGTLADYIPAVYVRLNRNEKWFLQGEFRYAAPQYTKSLVYNSQVIFDSSQSLRTTTVQRVKKTYYHQLPLSFNYYVMPRWSIGTGVIFNKFYSAVTSTDISQRRNGTNIDSFIVKEKIASVKNPDSNFVNSFFQLLFETQYKYKRFSLGARYTQGLSPYLKLNVPGGPSQEKNKSLQIFLRYELWNTKKK